jgi:hypothetical protein
MSFPHLRFTTLYAIPKAFSSQAHTLTAVSDHEQFDLKVEGVVTARHDALRPPATWCPKNISARCTRPWRCF